MANILRQLFSGKIRRPNQTAGASGQTKFVNSARYWEGRYQSGGNSGAGSYGRLADFKAEFLNGFVARHQIRSLIEFGPGDGNQLSLAAYPKYLGVDISRTAVDICREKFKDDATKSFMTVAEYEGQTADLAMSLDVIFHLVEDNAYHRYMTNLFSAAERFVIVYSSNSDEPVKSPHVRHRRFTDWVSKNSRDFALLEHLPNAFPFDPDDPENTSFADFFVFKRS